MNLSALDPAPPPGCTCPGDVAKAFGSGADFVMLGGMFAGHDESGGETVTKPDGELERTRANLCMRKTPLCPLQAPSTSLSTACRPQWYAERCIGRGARVRHVPSSLLGHGQVRRRHCRVPVFRRQGCRGSLPRTRRGHAPEHPWRPEVRLHIRR